MLLTCIKSLLLYPIAFRVKGKLFNEVSKAFLIQLLLPHQSHLGPLLPSFSPLQSQRASLGFFKRPCYLPSLFLANPSVYQVKSNMSTCSLPQGSLLYQG